MFVLISSGSWKIQNLEKLWSLSLTKRNKKQNMCIKKRCYSRRKCKKYYLFLDYGLNFKITCAIITTHDKLKGQNNPISCNKMGGYQKEIFRDGRGFEPKLVCNICELILREPVQAYCGHRFCRICLEARIREYGPMRCQKCEREDPEDVNSITQEQIFLDNGLKREMARLNVVCANPGCNWQGRFKQYEDHLDQACAKAFVICPQCGKEGLLRENLLSHQQSAECRGEPVMCPAGCGPIERKDYQEHFRRMNHEIWLAQKLEEINCVLEEQISRNNRFTEFDTQLATGLAETDEKLALVERLVNEITIRSNIPTESGGRQGTENIKVKISQVVTMQLQSVNKHLLVKSGKADCISLHSKMEKTITAIEKLERYNEQMTSTLYQLKNKVGSLERTVASQEITIGELELRVQSLEAASFDGTFIWSVTEFAKKHQEALNGRMISVYSPPFYTGRQGYKMCARLYPNGDGMGKGSHLSLFFVVMRGNFDPLLKWPFGQRITFCLINQNGKEHIVDTFRPDPQSSSFKRPTSDMNIASGCPLFVRLGMLQNPNNGFLKDDTMFLKVSVDVSDLSDPISTLEE